MIKREIWILSFVLLIAGCSTDKMTVQKSIEQATVKEEKEIVMAPGNKREFFEKAKAYLKNRDYANALINIIRAEKAEGGDELTYEIRAFKNNLIEKLNARAMYEKEDVEVGKGLKKPLQYMVFYMEEEVIYPAFNIPVAFGVKKGEAKITEKGFTNTSGIAECEVSRVESLVEDELIISAGVHLHIEGETFTIAKLEREFALRYATVREQAISFVVFEKNIDEVVLNSTSGKLIEDLFIKNGFSVFHGVNEDNRELFINATNGDIDSLRIYQDKLKSNLIAFTYIESGLSSQVTEGFYFAKANIILNIVDVRTNKIVFNSVIEDIKGAGNTEQKAGRKAINDATKSFIEKLENEISGIK